ncbi:unnamed protein product [Caenorhabditis angaria]|uniref:Uncharacterized protein n=1 Tax=Caenorhabditis angaria TaxID=860376 RepID=A0A9P1I4W0_9PELO|nr:unnamed protein product [Caenorhabditis angaria]
MLHQTFLFSNSRPDCFFISLFRSFKLELKMITWTSIKRGFPIYSWPILAATAIFVDWNHTREWKAAGKVSMLQKEILGNAK